MKKNRIPSVVTSARIEVIPISSVNVNEVGRRPLNLEHVDILAISIARDGLLQPIEVIRSNTGILKGEYVLCAGDRRRGRALDAITKLLLLEHIVFSI